ncbi:hypothetical protein [Frankia sp. Cr2]|nr:hypothetical protein [Frankia sp. Cr2]
MSTMVRDRANFAPTLLMPADGALVVSAPNMIGSVRFTPNRGYRRAPDLV